VGRPLWVGLLLPQILHIPPWIWLYRLVWDKTFKSNDWALTSNNDTGTYAHIPATALVTKAVVNLQLCLPNKSASQHSGTVTVLHTSTQRMPGCLNHDWHSLTTLDWGSSRISKSHSTFFRPWPLPNLFPFTTNHPAIQWSTDKEKHHELQKTEAHCPPKSYAIGTGVLSLDVK
jgi:hypothetical protein